MSEVYKMPVLMHFTIMSMCVWKFQNRNFRQAGKNSFLRKITGKITRCDWSGCFCGADEGRD